MSRSSKKKRLASKRKNFAKGFEPCIGCQQSIHHNLYYQSFFAGNGSPVCNDCLFKICFVSLVVAQIKWLVEGAIGSFDYFWLEPMLKSWQEENQRTCQEWEDKYGRT